MLLQALAEYADNYLSEELNDKAWEEKPVEYFLALTEQGAFSNVVHNMDSVVRGKKTVSLPGRLRVPKSPVSRNAGLHPLLAADDVRYVLGAGRWTTAGQEENNRERFEAFARLIAKAAAETQDEGLLAAAKFYERPDQIDLARAAIGDAKAGSTVALALLNTPIVNRRAVQTYWTAHYDGAAGERVSGDAECLISGKLGPVARTHDKIKGLSSLGGQAAGVSLMSFDKDAFRSYGWEQNANSPVSPDRAMAYVLALNDLLRGDGTHRRDIAGVGFLFWTKEKTNFNPMFAIDQAQPEEVGRLLSFSRDTDPDPNMFYMLGVAGNGGRMVIRYWVAETLHQVKENLRDWFDELRIADCFKGGVAEAPKLWQLLYALEREGKPPADRTVALIRRAIEGESQPLGYRILSTALTRLRAEKDKRNDAPRLGLIRICLNDSIRTRGKGERLMAERLDLEQKHHAYLCGRLMAVYEGLQYTASGEVNQTVADRYYTLASTYPAQAFPRLEDLGNKHLRKLRRDKPGAMVSISKQIDELHLEIEQASGHRFPGALDLDAQGRFALGYHHQRAHQMAQAQAAKRAKQEDSEE
jgi:CRISPR-associated protein Csd1